MRDVRPKLLLAFFDPDSELTYVAKGWCTDAHVEYLRIVLVSLSVPRRCKSNLKSVQAHFRRFSGEKPSMMGKSCSCYCGVATKANRFKWATAGGLFLVGTIFLLSFFARASKCSSAAVIGSSLRFRNNNHVLGANDKAIDLARVER